MISNSQTTSTILSAELSTLMSQFVENMRQKKEEIQYFLNSDNFMS